MTVQEVIKELQVGYLGDTEEIVQAKHEAIKALEEVEQYRALGTVEELKNQKHNLSVAYKIIDDYSKIGTMKELKESREKQVAKKVLYRKEHYGSPWHCPICEAEQIKVEFMREDGTEPKYMNTYCWHCGNKIDWKEGAE